MVKLAVPNSPDALQEFLTDPKNLGKIGTSPEEMGQFIENYRQEVNKSDPRLQEQLTDLQKAGFKKFMEDNGYEKKPVIRRLPGDDGGEPPAQGAGWNHPMYKGLNLTRQEARQVAANGRGLGTDQVGKFANAGDFLRKIGSTVNNFPGGLDRLGNLPEARLKDMSSVISGDGGFLVPEEFRAELLKLALEQAIIRPRARIVPMTRQTLRYPAIRETSHASTVYGNVNASWIAEAASVSTVTQPTFAQIRLDAKKLTGYTVASNELLEDSAIALEALIMSIFPEVLAYMEDDAFMVGTGAGQPLGILNADALVSVAKETGQAATTIVWENIIKMFSRMLPQSLGRGIWIAHQDTFPQLMTMSLSVGTGGAPVMLTNGAGGPPATMLGRPVILTEKCRSLGTAGDIFFVDLGYYLIGDRQALTIAASPHVNFTTDEMTWRFIQRVDGRPWITSALTPRNGSNTVSPYVALATRA